MGTTPKRSATVKTGMRSVRQQHRGLAEIVGTLMLVVIVVAAATAFSFFVSAYERQVLSEESQQHDRTLEVGKVAGIQQCTASNCSQLYCTNNTDLQHNLSLLGCANGVQHLPDLVLEGREAVLNVSFVSGDVNSMFFTQYLLNGQASEGWLFYPHGATPRWMSDLTETAANWTACQPTQNISGSIVSVNSTCSEIPPYGQVNISIFTSTALPSPISLEMYTSLSDTFEYSFTPPVPVIKTTVLPEGSISEPLFDGSSSYQPAGGDNASITGYSWSFVDLNNSSATILPYQGPQIEVVNLSSAGPWAGNTFKVTLLVTNSDGLSASTAVLYEVPKSG
jgi:flagellin-like protein